jgi:hypothetical protein
MKLSSLGVGCRIPSKDIFAENNETEIMEKELFM